MPSPCGSSSPYDESAAILWDPPLAADLSAFGGPALHSTMPTNYSRHALVILVAAVAMCLGLWSWADTVYQSGARLTGWRLGMLGVAIPPLALGAYALWLRERRARGESGARVRWLKPVCVLALCLAALIALFPFM